MALVRWRPRRDLSTFQDEFNRFFEDFFQTAPSRTGLLEGVWNPATDVAETEDEITVRFELPGVSQEDVKISVTDDVLTVKGEKKHESEDKRHSYHRAECCYGAFQRSFKLPAAVDSSKIKATYKNGVLTVAVPKAEETKPKDIEIEVN